MGTIRRRAGGALARVRRAGTTTFGGLPKWAKPSNVTAGIGVTVGIGELILTPLANGDSWVGRLTGGYKLYKETGNPMELLQEDGSGNNTASIAVAQMKQNAGGAVLTIAGFGVAAGILKYFGM